MADEEARSWDYEPVPVDSSEVALTEPLLELTEVLAPKVHDLWARQRLEGGLVATSGPGGA